MTLFVEVTTQFVRFTQSPEGNLPKEHKTTLRLVKERQLYKKVLCYRIFIIDGR